MINSLDIIILIILVVLVFKNHKLGLNYYTIVNIILFINLFGNLIIESETFSVSNNNLFLFILVHSVSYSFFFNKNYTEKSNISVTNNPEIIIHPKILLFLFIALCLLVVFFYSQVGILVLEDDILEARKKFGYGKGIFSRIILHFIPIVASFYLVMYLRYKNKLFLIPPILSILFISLSGYRGFVLFTLVYFGMVYTLKRDFKFSIFKVATLGLVFIYGATLLTNKIYEGLTFEESSMLMIRRIFLDNVYGYNILINKYLQIYDVGFFESNNLAHDLFIYEFGSGGKIAGLGGELTYTLPGWCFAMGGLVLSGFISFFIGLIAGINQRLLILNKKNDFQVVLRSFFLFTIILLMNKGYVLNYFSIIFLSLAMFYLFSQSPVLKLRYFEKNKFFN
jgi:hypothetical protein